MVVVINYFCQYHDESNRQRNNKKWTNIKLEDWHSEECKLTPTLAWPLYWQLYTVSYIGGVLKLTRSDIVADIFGDKHLAQLISIENAVNPIFVL